MLSKIAEHYNQILRENLVGIYVHGSIGFGCFSWDRSDIDFIVVVNKPVSQQTKRQLLRVLKKLGEQAPPKGFEMSVVLEKYCKTFVYPTPYELHFNSVHTDEYTRELLSLCNDERIDEDLAAHFTVIKNVGVVLCGAAIEDVFGDVPGSDYLDSISKDVENAKEHVNEFPVYIILNLCRVCAYINDGLVLSKEQGGNGD